jgi:hypothetical protein
MGGFGSGQRWNSKARTSSYSRLDVRNWQQRGFLVVGRRFVSGAWEIEVIASMKRDEPNTVCLYPRDGWRQQREPYRVWIEWTPCNYGGKRAWFVCPRGCGHRVAILYYGDSPACRHCYQLAYESQQDSGWNRLLRLARTSRMQLGGSANLAEPLPDKPKGMHWRTYSRLYRQAAAREQGFLAGAVNMLTSLDKSNSRFNGRG